jgi:hypothetical protein
VGQRIEVLSQPLRRSVKVLGAFSLSYNPRFSFAFTERFNAKSFLKFLKRLVNNSPRKVLMILDNVRYHHARVVQEWVEANSDRIELHFLPPYSPEFNPIDICGARQSG